MLFILNIDNSVSPNILVAIGHCELSFILNFTLKLSLKYSIVGRIIGGYFGSKHNNSIVVVLFYIVVRVLNLLSMMECSFCSLYDYYVQYCIVFFCI